jgi:hypothetical protein
LKVRDPTKEPAKSPAPCLRGGLSARWVAGSGRGAQGGFRTDVGDVSLEVVSPGVRAVMAGGGESEERSEREQGDGEAAHDVSFQQA